MAHAREAMFADWGKLTWCLEIHVVGNGQKVSADIDQVECVFVTLASTAAARGGGAALHDDDAAISVGARKKIK